METSRKKPGVKRNKNNPPKKWEAVLKLAEAAARLLTALVDLLRRFW